METWTTLTVSSAVQIVLYDHVNIHDFYMANVLLNVRWNFN